MASTEPSMTEHIHAARRLCRREPFSRPDRSAPDAIRKAAPQDLQALFSAPVRL